MFVRRFVVSLVATSLLLAGGLAPKAEATDAAFVGVCTMNFTLSPAPPLVGSGPVTLTASGTCFIDGVTPHTASISPTTLVPGPLGFGCGFGEAATGLPGTFQVNIGTGWSTSINVRVVSAAGSYLIEADYLAPHLIGVGAFSTVPCGATSVLGAFVFEDPDVPAPAS